jgi:hypothetical protein
MGRSRGGLTSKIHAVVDTNGLPVRLGLTAREQRIASEAIESTGMQLGRTQMKHASSRSRVCRLTH